MSRLVRSPVGVAVALALASPSIVSHALAADAAKPDENTLQEIVVTAQFVQQNVQDTPIAITAVTAEMLEARSQQTVEQVANQAPNVTLKAAGTSAGPSLIGFIRGIGQTDFNPAMEPGVGLYVDDVYYSTLTGSVLDLLDLDRVDILRGPQGTLAGKNSIGGAIKLYSKKPTGSGGGFVEAGYGDLNAVTVRGATDVVLSPDKMFVRFAGVSRSRDGYVKNLDYRCTHPNATDVPTVVTRGGSCVLSTEGGIRYTGGRISLRWLPSDSLEVNLAADATSDHSDPPANTLTNVSVSFGPVGINTDNNAATGYIGFYPALGFIPPFQTGLDVMWNGLNLPANLSACRYIAYGPHSCDPQSPNTPFVNYSNYLDARAAAPGSPVGNPWTPTYVAPVQTLSAKGVSLNLDWRISDALSVQSISAWRTYRSSFADDADGTPLPLQLLLQTLNHTQKSEELRLNGKAGSFLDYTVGGFYFDQQTAEDALVDIPYVDLNFIHGPDHVPAKTKALFAHGIFHLGADTNLAAGVRRTDEKKTYTYQRHNPDGTLPCTVAGENCALSGLNGLSGVAQATRTDYRIALDHKWTEDVMTYAQYSTGYKGGGIDPRPFYPQQVLSFDPETVKAYEVGAKNQLFNRTLRLNVALFYNKYNDIQLGLNDCSKFTGPPGNPWGIPCILPANVGDAKMKGAELEFEWHPVSGLEMDGSYSKLKFEYTRVDPATGVPLSGISAFTPENKWSAGIQYKIDAGNGGSVTPRVDASYQSDIFANAINSPDAKIDSYTLVNAHLTWRSPDDAWRASLDVENLTNKIYFLTKFDLIPALGGFASGQPGLPRTWMVTLKRSF